MNLNKYLIAAMITVGVMTTAAAQNSNNSVNSKHGNARRGPEPGVVNSAKQSQEMKLALALNESQMVQVKKINYSYAREIEVARIECGDDVTGFNSYVDRVSLARDKQLKSVLTPSQFADYTSRKSSKNWLGMDNFKYKSEDGDLKVKNESKELKIKGKNNIASAPYVDQTVQNNSQMNKEEPNEVVIDNSNITLDTMASIGEPEIKTYPGEEEKPADVERVKPEYDNMYADMPPAKNKEEAKKTKSGSAHKKSTASSKSKTNSKATASKSTAKKSTAKAPKSAVASSSKSKTKKTNTAAKSGTVHKKKKSTETATAKKKVKADTCVDQSSSRIKPVTPDTMASAEPMDSSVFILPEAPDTTAEILVVPDTSASIQEVPDTTSSASGREPNYFINKDSKAKFSEGESKIKPDNHTKMKGTDQEAKSKNAKDKVKEEDKETKVKEKDFKIKSNK
jgi:hypothetical protein